MALSRQEHIVNEVDYCDSYQHYRKDTVVRYVNRAVMLGDVNAVRGVCATNAHEVDINLLFDGALCPIHMALKLVCAELLGLLLQFGAAINAVDAERNSVLHHAIMSGNETLISTLIDYHVNKNMRNHLQQTALHLAVSVGNNYACDALLGFDCKVNVYDYKGRSPLHLATQRGDVSMFRKLMICGADIYHADCRGNTVLHYAVSMHHMHMVKIIGANTKLFLQKNVTGNKASDYASTEEMKRFFYSLDFVS